MSANSNQETLVQKQLIRTVNGSTPKLDANNWIGEIPRTWRLVKLKYVADIFASNVDKKTVDGQSVVRLCNYTDVYYNERINPEMDFMTASATSEQIEKFSLKKNDVIITKDSETPDDIGIATYVSEDIPGVICGYHLSMIRPKNNNSGIFLKHLFDSHYVKSKFETQANGVTRYGLGSYAVENLLIPLPPADEQKNIANFLDRETSKIDELIQKQERLIGFLEEKRQVAISNAITKGFKLNVKFKNSQVEWYGQIPEEWIVTKFKYLIVKPLQYGASESGDDFQEGHPRYVRITDIDSNSRLKVENIKTLPPDIASQYMLNDGDILFARSGATVGKSFIYETSFGPACFAGYLIKASVDIKKIKPKYLKYITESHMYWEYILGTQSKSTIQNVNAEKYSELPIPLPSIEEQDEICEKLEAICYKVNQLLDFSRQSIGLLKERRASLISAAVTGKIDVRELV